MSKTVALLKALPQIGGDEFSGWLLHDALPKALSGCPDARRCVVYLPQALRSKPGTETPKTLPYQAIIETWFAGDDGRGARALIADPGFAARVGESHEYGVAEWVVKDELDTAHQGMSPGVVLWTILTRRAGLRLEEFHRYWAEHAPLALRVHVGMAAYAQNRVDSILGADAPPCDGFGVLHFRTDEDLRDRLFVSQQDVDAVLADSAKFSGNSLSMVCREYVVHPEAKG